MKSLPALTLLALLCSCSHFSIQQEETALDGTRRFTSTKGFTFLDGKSDAAKVRASTSDKTQTQSIGALGQESSSTGVVQIIKIVVEGAKVAVP